MKRWFLLLLYLILKQAWFKYFQNYLNVVILLFTTLTFLNAKNCFTHNFHQVVLQVLNSFPPLVALINLYIYFLVTFICDRTRPQKCYKIKRSNLSSE